ncbi:MAG TPA: cytochrome c maturation protein CcmE [Acidimicrobiales bacterium]|nr:cytochrome c maturation protein CcmE [Acidimicrobiales bacterium]
MTATAPAPRVRPAAPAATKWRVAAVLVVIAAAIGFLVFKGLGDATVYFRTADEAVAEKSELGDHRFRVEGAVVTDSVHETDGGVRFDIISAGVVVPVLHRGDPPELFKPGIPVVLEGHWDGDVYASDRIMVKHTSEYREKNPDRVDEYVGKGDS